MPNIAKVSKGYKKIIDSPQNGHFQINFLSVFAWIDYVNIADEVLFFRFIWLNRFPSIKNEMKHNINNYQKPNHFYFRELSI